MNWRRILVVSYAIYALVAAVGYALVGLFNLSENVVAVLVIFVAPAIVALVQVHAGGYFSRPS